MNLEKKIALYEKESIEAFKTVPSESIVDFIEKIFEAYEEERTIFCCGNGGNVASVQNLVCDLNHNPFVSENKDSQNVFRNNFKAVSLCFDQATLTGISNDLGFENIFLEQLKFQGKENDILFGMSGSGNSKNILKAFEFAKHKKMKTILVTRSPINKCNEFSDLTISLNYKSNICGQIGKNNSNYLYEDFISKLTHIVVSCLKQKVQDEIRS